jgi:poly(A) polymerase
MSGAGSIGIRSWMSDPATGAVIEALETADGPGCARFVGGCVRNSLLGSEVADIDIATRLKPAEVILALEARGLKAIATGIEHGTVTAISAGKPFEITTLRQDIETDGRHAVVAFTDDWSQDAARRDFCLNAIYCDRLGQMTDPTGRGIEDARAGRIVFVGTALDRIREDYLRILRYFRFLAWYGRGEPDVEALEACAQLKGGIQTLSSERVQKELLKLLEAEDPVPSLHLMAETGVLPLVLRTKDRLEVLTRLVQGEREGLPRSDAGLRLAALVDPETPVAEWSRGLRLSNGLRDRISAAWMGEPVAPDLSAHQRRVARYKLGGAVFRDKAQLTRAATPQPGHPEAWIDLIEWASLPAPVFPLSGEDILATGVPLGPLIGQVRQTVESWWIDNDFVPDKEALVEHLRSVAEGIVS